MAKKKKAKKRKNYWYPHKGASSYFYVSSDDDFKSRHPVGYVFFVTLGIIALLAPSTIYYIIYVCLFNPSNNDNPWILLGFTGGFIVGIGLFNFVAIIIKQYLGHLVSIASFLIGSILMAISLTQMYQ